MIIKAKYALLARGEVRCDVRMEIWGDRIADVSSGFSPYALHPDIDFGEAVITPGFINAHCHLELEFCQDKARYDGSFVDWLQHIRDLKCSHPDQASLRPGESLKAMAASGCTTLLDHHTADLDWDFIEKQGLRYVPLKEFFQIGNAPPDREEMRKSARLGYAPHSPYTAGLALAKVCRELSDQAGVPMSVHISEFPGEINFIRDGRDDEIIELLKRAKVYDSSWQGTGKSPIRHYADEGLLDGPTYAVHCNYLERGNLDILSSIKPTVVFCPRSHAYFGHDTHPIATYLAAGVPVALGTDSLASNDALSPLHEASMVLEKYPQVSPEDVFSAITTTPLVPLGWQDRLGKLLPGCLADFAVFKLDGDPGSDFDSVFRAVVERGQAELTVAGGKVIHQAAGQVAAKQTA